MKHASYSTFSIFSYYSIWYLEFIDTTLIFTYPVDPLSPVGFFFSSKPCSQFRFPPPCLCYITVFFPATIALSSLPPTPDHFSNIVHPRSTHPSTCIVNKPLTCPHAPPCSMRVKSTRHLLPLRVTARLTSLYEAISFFAFVSLLISYMS